MRFSNKVVLVTGSSRGIGRSVAIAFAKEGANVIINYHSNDIEAEIVKEIIKSYNVKCLTVKADISKSNEVKHMVKTIIDEFGRIDILVNNASVCKDSLLMDKDVDSFIPENCKTNYIDLKKAEDNLYKIFQFTLISSQNEITKYLGVNEGIENRLLSFINEKDFSSFIKKVETKRYTRSYIKRLILHIVLKVNKDFVPQYHHHLRILGMNTNGKKFVSTFKSLSIHKSLFIPVFLQRLFFIMFSNTPTSGFYIFFIQVFTRFVHSFNYGIERNFTHRCKSRAFLYGILR